MPDDRHNRIHRASDMPTVAATAKYLGNLLAKPCNCPRTGCTIGVHIFHATRDNQPGPKAQALDQERVNGTRNTGDITSHSNERDDHDELRRLAASINANYIALATMIAAQQHDRQRPTKGNDDDWCRNHLDTINTCEPRHRGDLCKWCYEFKLANRLLPPKPILEVRHAGGRVTSAMVAEAKRATKKRKRKRRSK